jgi:hypothetical protein
MAFVSQRNICAQLSLGDGADGRLGVDVEGADLAGEAAVVAAGEGADLSHCRIS